MTHSALILLALLARAPTPGELAAARRALASGSHDYLELRFGEAVAALGPASRTFEAGLPATLTELDRAMALLATSYLGLGDRASAEATFVRLLHLQPDFLLDPVTFPPDAQSAFAAAKAAVDFHPQGPEPQRSPPPVQRAPPPKGRPVAAAALEQPASVSPGIYAVGGIGIASLIAGGIVGALALSLAGSDRVTASGGSLDHSLTLGQAQTANAEGVAAQILLAAGLGLTAGALAWDLVPGRPAAAGQE
ncbi:MAG: hypothetical protein ACYCWW_05955 [Deltaproteobacteria bacterium]